MLYLRSDAWYFVLPEYVKLSEKQQLNCMNFGLGFDVFPATPTGGIIRTPENITNADYVDFKYDVFPEFANSGIKGGTGGNATGLAIFERIALMIPCPIPALAVALGMARRPMKAPDVAATVEHSDDTRRGSPDNKSQTSYQTEARA